MLTAFLLSCLAVRAEAAGKREGGEKMSIEVTSTAFENEGMIPARYTCDGADVSPPVVFSGIPDGTKSLALICDDPDAPVEIWVHWVLYDLAPDVSRIPQAVPPDGTVLGGAKHVLQMDSSAPALEIAKQNAELNGLDPAASEYIEGDVFKELRRFRDSRREFDLIILDPPKFIESRNQIDKGARGYKDINLLAFKLLRPGGLLFTFSCSGHMEMPLFQKVVADSALDAGRNGQILAVLNQSPDHPIALNFPEGAYLKGLLCRAE